MSVITIWFNYEFNEDVFGWVIRINGNLPESTEILLSEEIPGFQSKEIGRVHEFYLSQHTVLEHGNNDAMIERLKSKLLPMSLATQLVNYFTALNYKIITTNTTSSTGGKIRSFVWTLQTQDLHPG